MSVKTVTLSEDAYLALAALKKEGESFSDVVRRLGHRLLTRDRSFARVPGLAVETY